MWICAVLGWVLYQVLSGAVGWSRGAVGRSHSTIWVGLPILVGLVVGMQRGSETS
jgi:hypothetical protein